MNPLYANIIIDDSSSSKEKIDKAIEHLVENPRNISSELEIAMEQVAAEERAATSELICEAPDVNTSGLHQLPMSFLTRASHNAKLPELRIFESLNAALSGDVSVRKIFIKLNHMKINTQVENYVNRLV